MIVNPYFVDFIILIRKAVEKCRDISFSWSCWNSASSTGNVARTWEEL